MRGEREHGKLRAIPSAGRAHTSWNPRCVVWWQKAPEMQAGRREREGTCAVESILAVGRRERGGTQAADATLRGTAENGGGPGGMEVPSRELLKMKVDPVGGVPQVWWQVWFITARKCRPFN